MRQPQTEVRRWDGDRGGIVVGLGGVSDEHAVDWALDEARRRRCGVRLVLGWVSDVVAAVRRGEEVLSRLDERTRRAVRLDVCRGDAATVWAHVASGAELMVVGGRRDGALPDGLRAVRCPVVLVSGGRVEVFPVGAAAATRAGTPE